MNIPTWQSGKRAQKTPNTTNILGSRIKESHQRIPNSPRSHVPDSRAHKYRPVKRERLFALRKIRYNSAPEIKQLGQQRGLSLFSLPRFSLLSRLPHFFSFIFSALPLPLPLSLFS